MSCDKLNKEFIIYYDINFKQKFDDNNNLILSENIIKIILFKFKKTKKYVILKTFFKKNCKNKINNLVFGYLMRFLNPPITKIELEFHLRK